MRNEEIAHLNKELLETKHLLGEREAELDDTRHALAEVEKKNRQLSERINEIIYNKAALYKEKTLEALRKSD